MNKQLLGRASAGLAIASLLAGAVAAPVMAAPPGGTSRNIVITGTSPIFDGVSGNLAISAGEQVAFTLTVTNGGQQTVNNISLVFGFDDNPLPQTNGDATPPTPFPTGVSVTTTNTACSGGTLLTCTIGTLAKGRSFAVSAVLTTTPDLSTYSGAATLVEAVVSVAEAGSDNGSNIDTFSSQGEIDLVQFSCDSVTAYRPGNANKTISTCATDDTRSFNRQQSAITLPSRLAVAVLTENATAACAVLGTCYGNRVDADVAGDETTDVISWSITIDLTGQSLPNLQKVVVYHTNDEGQAVTISVAKNNACKRATSTNCGSAVLNGNLLTVTFQTAGNGSSRVGLS